MLLYTLDLRQPVWVYCKIHFNILAAMGSIINAKVTNLPYTLEFLGCVYCYLRISLNARRAVADVLNMNEPAHTDFDKKQKGVNSVWYGTKRQKWTELAGIRKSLISVVRVVGMGDTRYYHPCRPPVGTGAGVRVASQGEWLQWFFISVATLRLYGGPDS